MLLISLLPPRFAVQEITRNYLKNYIVLLDNSLLHAKFSADEVNLALAEASKTFEQFDFCIMDSVYS